LKAITSCYHAVALILDYLDHIKSFLADFVGNPENGDQSLLRKPQKVGKKINNIDSSGGTIRIAFNQTLSSVTNSQRQFGHCLQPEYPSIVQDNTVKFL